MTQFQQEVVLNRRRVNLSLPSKSELVRFVGWSCGRLVLVLVPVTCDIGMFATKTVYSTLELLKRSWTTHILKTYDALPYQFADGGMTVTPVEPAVSHIQPLTDILKALEGKHTVIVGGTGTGKSTLAQTIAYQVGGTVKVYDPDCLPTEWQGLEVVGRKGDFQSINEAMQHDLVELQELQELRGEGGDSAIAGRDRVFIAEEFPILVEECEAASTWFKRHAKRGRRVRRFVIGIAQNDTVTNWGLEGDAGTLNSFCIIRLGKFAIRHAERLKDSHIAAWLRQQERPAMIDDLPLRLPEPTRMPFLAAVPATIVQPQGNHAITPQQSSEQSPEPAQEEGFEEIVPGGDRLLWRLICQLGDGKSDSAVVTEVLGYTGRRYQQGCELLADLRAKFGGADG